MPKPSTKNRYEQVIQKIFFDHYRTNKRRVKFSREEIISAADSLGLDPIKNPGDAVYSYRYRNKLPASILATQPEGFEWIIEGVGTAKYVFRLARICRVVPNENLLTIKLPDATPEIIASYALTDEQALLAKVRYNRLIDIFLGVTTYSLQSHLRTTVKEIGQIEIDEVYVGIDGKGRQFVIPVQAKGGSDKLSPVQALQDIACCAAKFPGLICRAISAQFMTDGHIAVFELVEQKGEIRIASEKHYQLVPADQISDEDLKRYQSI
ncbi:MAG: hypothetical protein SynsKO_41730 [Synoicihabitans sp.]